MMTTAVDAINDLTGSTALVTGATSGIGRASAVQLAAQGAEVIVHGRDAARGAEVVAQIQANGGTARFIAANLSDPAGAAALAAEAGAVDILINNAGFAWFGATSELSADLLAEMFVANVQAPYLLVAALAPKMVANGKGVIINVSSAAGSLGLVGAASYGATKAAVASLAQSWAAEYGPSGIRVNAIAPGPVYTNGAPRELFTQLAEANILKRVAEPEEIAEFIGFLASPRSAFITGAILPIDAGQTTI
jgi:NAD(P)-dependent dehydrogenase (short-subunit alcohol dehydrogenase family)